MALDTKDEYIARLKSELTVIETQITTIEQNGQEFRKGGDTGGFNVKFADLPKLYSRKDTIRSKLVSWENS